MSATITTARPAQALRQRRESQRPGIARVNTRATTVEAADSTPALPVPLGLSTPSIHITLLMEEIVQTPDYILKKFSGKRPSLILHLHPTHFRFDQQDGSFSYNSSMRIILDHLKDGTVPHIMIEELLAADVPWYDGCLIVEVHDHKTGAKSTPANATNQVGGSSNTPFSINNYNEHITASAFAPFPSDKLQLKPGGAKASSTGGDAVNGVKESDKENMPAPDHPASATQKKQAKGPRIFTVVLFPTNLSLEEEKNILARTPISDARGIKRILQASSRDGMTPTLGQPPTPLASVPSTPLTAKSTPRKQKMALDETNVHDFEAEVLRITNPKLYLEPVKNTNEMFDVLRALAHPLHSEKPTGPKTRKRTVAELAADEAQAANEELYALSLDERHQQSTAAGGVAASDGQAGAASSFEPTFKRFKTLENIKIKHAELEREKKEAAAREAHMKRQQSEADALKKQELDRRQAEQARLEQAKADLLKQQAMNQRLAQQQAQAQATPITSHPQHMSNMMPTSTHPQLQQVQNTTHMSPVLRQASQTPMNSSPMLGGPAMSSMPMTSLPTVATASNQGARSPARPPTSMSAHPNSAGMARQVSQQHQMGSGHGTPQMLSTPSMGPAVPVTRNMTPQPRAVTQQGSPIGPVQSTPMMATPSHMSQMTPEQQQQHAAMMQANQLRLQQQRGQHQQAAMRNNAGMQGSPQNMQQMMAMQQRQQQQMGASTPGQQNPQQMMANRQAMLQMQMQMQQQNAMQQGSPNNNMMSGQNQMVGQNNMQQQHHPLMAQIQAQRQQILQQYQGQRRQREAALIMQHGGGNPQAVPDHIRHQFQMQERQKEVELQQQVSKLIKSFYARADELKIQNLTRAKMAQLQAMQNQNMMRQQSGMNQNGPAPGAGAGMMQNVAQINNMMGAGGNPNAMAQYSQIANEQRQRLEQQQRAHQNMMGPGQGMQNMQNMNMQGMNMGAMSAAQMQQLQQNPALMNQIRMQQMQQQQMGQHMGMPQGGMPGQGMGM